MGRSKALPAYRRPVCTHCRKRTASRSSAVCRTCATSDTLRASSPPVCLVCDCRKGTNWENCRACELTVRIVILRARARAQWLQLKRAIKEMIHG